MRRRPRLSGSSSWIGLLFAGSAALVAIAETPYINWHSVWPPLDGQLVIRHDAKGDGRFDSPRSGNRRHRGIDLAGAIGTPVHAIRSGRVAEAANHRGLGRYIVLDHTPDLYSLYAHLQEISVRPGQRVRQGQVIGLVGKTGNARHRWIEPHLHLEVVRDGEPVNPAHLGLTVVEPASTVAGMKDGDDGRGGE